MKNKQQNKTKQPAKSATTKTEKPLINPKYKWALLAGIVLLTFISFYPALKNDFTNWDDDHYVSKNEHLAKPVKEAASYFFNNFYFSNYIPLTMIVYTLEYHATEINKATNEPKAIIFHTVNIIFHLINVMLVFWFIYLLSRKRLDVAIIVALLFGIHPMHVESVAWVAELKDVMYTMFFILGLIIYYKYIDNPDKKKLSLYLLTLIVFCLSGLSKPAAATFPLSLILIDFYYRRKFTLKVWLEKVPFFTGAAVISYLTFKAQVETAIGSLDQYSIVERFMLSSYAMLDYIVKLFVPVHLSALHPYPHLLNGHLPTIYYITPFIALALFVLIYLTLRRSRLIVFGFLFFLMNIILVLQFLSVGTAITSDRYSYVPYIGLFFILAMGFHQLYYHKEKRFAMYKTIAVVAFIVFSGTLIVATQARCKVWKNNEIMWTDVIEKYPNSFMAYDNRGTYYRSIKNNDKALQDYINTIKNNPKYALGYNNRGDIYFDQGKDSMALIDYNQALALDPKLANTYTNRALVFCRRQQYDVAMQDFDRAYQADSSFDKLYYNRGILYDVMNKEDLAIADFRKYLKTNPYDDGIMNSIGVCYQKDKKYAESIVEFDKAIELKPAEPSYYMNKSISEHFLNQDDKARADALTAKKLGGTINPNYAKALGMGE